MKRWIAGLLVLGLVAVVLAGPTPAEAYRRGHYGHHQHNGGPFLGALAIGAVSGLLIGSVLAAPKVYGAPPVVYQPEPVYVAPAPVYPAPAPAPAYFAPSAAPAPAYFAPPAPVCTNYWVNTYWDGRGWVQGHWQQVCR